MGRRSAASIVAAGNAGAVRGVRGNSAPGALARLKPWLNCTSILWLCLGYIIGVFLTMFTSFKLHTPAWSDPSVGGQRINDPQTFSEHRTIPACCMCGRLRCSGASGTAGKGSTARSCVRMSMHIHMPGGPGAAALKHARCCSVTCVCVVVDSEEVLLLCLSIAVYSSVINHIHMHMQADRWRAKPLRRARRQHRLS